MRKLALEGKIGRISSADVDTGKVTDLTRAGETSFQGVKTEQELVRYLNMPIEGGLESVEYSMGCINKLKNDLVEWLERAKTEQPNLQIKELLFKHWGAVEACYCCFTSDMMKVVEKSYLEVVKQLGLYEKLEQLVNLDYTN